jgi:probable HAF family extracellular repeat protein
MRTMRTAVVVAVAAGVVLTVGATGTASADTDGATHGYRAIKLGTLAGGPSSFPTALNDHGDVVGYSQLPNSPFSHAFRWHRGQLTDLGVLNPGFPVSSAADINNAGQIVGDSAAPSGGFHAVLWQRGTMVDLGTLGGASSRATSINDRGQIVGMSQTSDGAWHAFSWKRGVMVDLGIGTVETGTPLVVNNVGQVAGGVMVGTELHAFRWQRGHLTDLGSLAGFGYANAINDFGTVVGFTRLPSGWGHAFVWRHGPLTDLGILGGGTGYSSANSINDLGQIVGNSDVPGGGSHGVLWRHGVLVDLTTRGVSPDAFVYAINIHGSLIASLPLGPGGARQAVLYV